MRLASLLGDFKILLLHPVRRECRRFGDFLVLFNDLRAL